ncbi:MAG: hypothetical protein IJP00_03115 [Firmicutes bacterium]|nr:hypothetical protein [Bacillota bacterium]
MNDALGMLVIIFLGLSIVGLAGVILQFVLKDEKKQKLCFYISAITAMVFSWNAAMMTPGYMEGHIAIIQSFAVLAAVAMMLTALGKNKKLFTAAKILVTIAVAAGMILMLV